MSSAVELTAFALRQNRNWENGAILPAPEWFGLILQLPGRMICLSTGGYVSQGNSIPILSGMWLNQAEKSIIRICYATVCGLFVLNQRPVGDCDAVVNEEGLWKMIKYYSIIK